jgi:4-hydroxy-tetrahydrodipicolinate reductase
LPDCDGCIKGSDLDLVLPEVPGAVIVDFSSPESSLAAASAAGRHGAFLVVGTTGFNPVQKRALEEAAMHVPLFWSPNMSVGVSVLLKILPQVAALLGDSYDMEVLEIHHNQKKDAPSGTALRLAASMAGVRDWQPTEVMCCRREGLTGERPHREIGIQALRGGDVPGIHTAYFFGPGERIEITHQAHSRDNFAQGALLAARWLHGKAPGALYGMEDMLP